jgi:hypothetical protein
MSVYPFDVDLCTISVIGSGSVPECYRIRIRLSIMITTKLTGSENLTTYTCWLGPSRPTDKENKVKS